MGNSASDVNKSEVRQSEPNVWDRISEFAAELSNGKVPSGEQKR